MRHRITRFVVFTLIIAVALLEALRCTPSRHWSEAYARNDGAGDRTDRSMTTARPETVAVDNFA
jgi:hypothetical protein